MGLIDKIACLFFGHEYYEDVCEMCGKHRKRD